MNAHQLMSILFSVLRLEMIEGRSFLEELAQQLMQLEIPIRSTSDVTKLMFGIGLGKRHISWSLDAVVDQHFWVFPSERKLMTFLKDVLKKDKERLRQLTETECAHVLFALSQFRNALQGEEQLLQLICHQLAEPAAVKQLNETYHVLVITSLAALDLDHHLLIDRLLQTSIQSGTLGMYMAQELVTILYCLGSLRHWNQEAIECLLSEILKPQHLKSLTEQGVANVIYGIGRQGEMSGLDKERFILPLFAEAARSHRLKNYIGVGLTGILYAAGLMGFPSGRHRHHLTPFLEELVSPERLANTSSQGLATALWGMGKVGWTERHYIDLILKESVNPQRLRGMQNQGLGMLAYCCGLLKHHDSDLVGKLVMEATRPERLQRLTNQDISQLAYGIGRTNCVPLSIVNPLIQEALKPERLTSFESKHICQVLQAATVLDYRYMGDLRSFLKELANEERLSKLDSIELQEILISCSRKVALIKFPQAKAILKMALREDVLSQTRAPQLSSLATVISMHHPFLKLRAKDLEPFVNEVTKAERLAEFNPVDLTGLYTTLIRLGNRYTSAGETSTIKDAFREEEKLVSILDTLEKKPLSPIRKPIQFVNALIATNRIGEMPLHGLLLEKLLHHVLQASNLSLFEARDAFAMTMTLLASHPSTDFHATWQGAICSFAQLAQKGSLSNISITHLTRCLHHLVKRQSEVPAEADILSLILPEICDVKKMQLVSDEMLVELAEDISQLTSSSGTRQSEALATLHLAMERTNRLKTLSKSHATKLEFLFQQFAPQLTLAGRKFVRTTGPYSYETHFHARDLERLTGCADE